MPDDLVPVQGLQGMGVPLPPVPEGTAAVAYRGCIVPFEAGRQVIEGVDRPALLPPGLAEVGPAGDREEREERDRLLLFSLLPAVLVELAPLAPVIEVPPEVLWADGQDLVEFVGEEVFEDPL